MLSKGYTTWRYYKNEPWLENEKVQISVAMTAGSHEIIMELDISSDSGNYP